MHIKSREKSKASTILPTENTHQTSEKPSKFKKYFVIFGFFIFTFVLLFVSLSSTYEGEEKDEKILIESLYHFQLAKIFSSNMVLPRAPRNAKIWGWCNNPHCQVSLLFEGVHYNSTVETVYEAEGEKFEWEIELPPTRAGGPYILAFSDGRNTITLKNVLFGDIYLCSGEGNMQQTVRQSFHPERELNRSSNYLRIRLYTVIDGHSDYELKDFPSAIQRWSMASPSSLGNHEKFTFFSSICWHFGRNLYERVQVPIGLISSTYFEAPIQSWIPKENRFDCATKVPEVSLTVPTEPGKIYNYLISPIKEYGVTAVLWYQGESNIMNQEYYKCAFPSMISGWRREFNNSVLPFFYVNLHPYFVSDIDTSLAQFRLLQTTFAHSVKFAYMIAATDQGDIFSPYDPTYPRNKADIGRRFEVAVASRLYHSGDIPMGPVPISAELALTDPSPLSTNTTYRIKIVFQKGTTGDHLIFKNNTCPQGAAPFCGRQYEILFQDGNWVDAKAEVYQKHQVHVLAEYYIKIKPVSIRYGFADWPVCNLYNEVNLPAVPFQLKIQTQ